MDEQCLELIVRFQIVMTEIDLLASIHNVLATFNS